MRATSGLVLVGLGIVLPLALSVLGPWALLASWAAALGGLALLLRAPGWRRPAILGIGLLNALVALAVTGAMFPDANPALADVAVAAGALAASFAGGLALAAAPALGVRKPAAAALVLGACALSLVGAGAADGSAFLVALVYALLTFAWGIGLFRATHPTPATPASTAAA